MTGAATGTRTWRSAGSMVCLVLACLTVGACRGRAPAPPQDGASNGARAFSRAMWVWDARVITDQAKREELLGFCREKQIGLLFAEVGSIFAEPSIAARKPRVTPDQLADFALAVHEAGMKLDALDGDAPWSRTQNHGAAVGRLEKALAFNQARRTKNEKLDGFQFDIEPHTLKGLSVGSDEWKQVLGEYLDLVSALTGVVKKEAPDFDLGFAIPYWWDDENPDANSVAWKGGTKPAAYHLLDAIGSLPSSHLAIMAYRDQAGGADGSIAHSEQELSYADKQAPAVRIFIGQETADVPGEPKKTTFWQEGEEALNQAVSEIETTLGPHKTFTGVAIHHYDSYRKLAQMPEQQRDARPIAAKTQSPSASQSGKLSITSPREGEKVAQSTTVYGTAPASYAGKRVKVSVLPKGDIWYEQGINDDEAGKVGADGGWEVECVIGNATASGTKFTIKAELEGKAVRVHVTRE